MIVVFFLSFGVKCFLSDFSIFFISFIVCRLWIDPILSHINKSTLIDFNSSVINCVYMFQIKKVSARSCEGGHRCTPPKECCAQGCCYLYAPPSAPKAPQPNNTSHVLNLFFINHWFFWLVNLITNPLNSKCTRHIEWLITLYLYVGMCFWSFGYYNNYKPII